MGQAVPALAPGELIRTSGKFPKPTKIPGKTYCKDEIVIRNADSGKGKCDFSRTFVVCLSLRKEFLSDFKR